VGASQYQNSTFNYNQSSEGGAIGQSNGPLTVSGSTFEYNTAIIRNSSIGGAVYIYQTNPQANPTFTNDTFYQNTAFQDASGIYSDFQYSSKTIPSDTTNLLNSTLLQNKVTHPGSTSGNNIDGLLVTRFDYTIAYYVHYAIANSVISDYGQTANVGNCGQKVEIIDNGHNWEEDQSSSFVTNSCGLNGSWGSTVPTWPSPVLLPLGSNGGPTYTAAINTSNDTVTTFSPLIDNVPGPNCPATDQTGSARPDNVLGFPNNNNCDIGAVEVGSYKPVVNTLDDQDLGN